MAFPNSFISLWNRKLEMGENFFAVREIISNQRMYESDNEKMQKVS